MVSRLLNQIRAHVRQQLHLGTVWLAIAGVIALLSITCATPVLAAESYNQRYLVDADFSGQALQNSSFVRADLRQSNFANADLEGASLFSANLESANLEGANLRNATLDLASFSRANLTNAILEGAFAFNAKFDGANITGADFTDVFLRKDAQQLLCQVANGTNPVTGRKTRETLLCD